VWGLPRRSSPERRQVRGQLFFNIVCVWPCESAVN